MKAKIKILILCVLYLSMSNRSNAGLLDYIDFKSVPEKPVIQPKKYCSEDGYFVTIDENSSLVSLLKEPCTVYTPRTTDEWSMTCRSNDDEKLCNHVVIQGDFYTRPTQNQGDAFCRQQGGDHCVADIH